MSDIPLNPSTRPSVCLSGGHLGDIPDKRHGARNIPTSPIVRLELGRIHAGKGQRPDSFGATTTLLGPGKPRLGMPTAKATLLGDILETQPRSVARAHRSEVVLLLALSPAMRVKRICGSKPMDYHSSSLATML